MTYIEDLLLLNHILRYQNVGSLTGAALNERAETALHLAEAAKIAGHKATTVKDRLETQIAELEGSHKLALEQNVALQKEIVGLKMKNAKLVNEVGAANNEAGSLTAQLSVELSREPVRADVDRLTRALHELQRIHKEKTKEAEEDLSQLRAANKRQAMQIERYSTENSTFVQKEQEERVAIQNLRTQLNARDHELEALRQAQRDASGVAAKALGDAEYQVSELKSHLEAKEKLVKGMMEELKRAHVLKSSAEAEKEAIQKSHHEVSADVAGLEAGGAKLKEQLFEQQRLFAEHKQEWGAKEMMWLAEKEELAMVLELSKQDLRVAQEAHKTGTDALLAQCAEVCDTRDLLQTQLEQRAKQLREAQVQAEERGADLKAAGTSLVQFRTELEANEAERANLVQRLQQSSATQGEHLERIAGLERKVADNEAEIGTLKAEATTQAAQSAAQTTEINAQNSKLAAQNTQLDTLFEEKDKLLLQAKEKEKELLELENMLLQAKEYHVLSLNTELAALRADALLAQDNLKKSHEQVLEDHKSKMKDSHEKACMDIHAAHATTSDNLTAQHIRLIESLSEMHRAELANCDEENARLMRVHAEQLDQRDKEIAADSDLVEKLTQELSALRKDLGAAMKSSQEKEKEHLLEIQKHAQELRAEHEKMHAEKVKEIMDTHEETKNTLVTELKEAESELSVKAAHLEMSHNMVQSLTTQKSEHEESTAKQVNELREQVSCLTKDLARAKQEYIEDTEKHETAFSRLEAELDEQRRMFKLEAQRADRTFKTELAQAQAAQEEEEQNAQLAYQMLKEDRDADTARLKAEIARQAEVHTRALSKAADAHTLAVEQVERTHVTTRLELEQTMNARDSTYKNEVTGLQRQLSEYRSASEGAELKVRELSEQLVTHKKEKKNFEGKLTKALAELSENKKESERQCVDLHQRLEKQRAKMEEGAQEQEELRRSLREALDAAAAQKVASCTATQALEVERLEQEKVHQRYRQESADLVASHEQQVGVLQTALDKERASHKETHSKHAEVTQAK